MEHLDVFARVESSDDLGQIDGHSPDGKSRGSSYSTSRYSTEQSTWSFPGSSCWGVQTPPDSARGSRGGVRDVDRGDPW